MEVQHLRSVRDALRPVRDDPGRALPIRMHRVHVVETRGLATCHFDLSRNLSSALMSDDPDPAKDPQGVVRHRAHPLDREMREVDLAFDALLLQHAIHVDDMEAHFGRELG